MKADLANLRKHLKPDNSSVESFAEKKPRGSQAYILPNQTQQNTVRRMEIYVCGESKSLQLFGATELLLAQAGSSSLLAKRKRRYVHSDNRVNGGTLLKL